MTNKTKITQAQLKEILTYNPETGIFTRKNGKIAGTRMKAGYILIGINYKMYYAHRLAWIYMTGSEPPTGIDHMDGCKDNNKFANLRLATQSQNCFNTGLRKHNTSGFRGVSYQKTTQGLDKPWKAIITVNKKRTFLGYYETPEEASKAYLFAAEHVLCEQIDFLLMREKSYRPS